MPHIALYQGAAVTALGVFDEGSVANVLELSGTVDPAVQITGYHAHPVEETPPVRARFYVGRHHLLDGVAEIAHRALLYSRGASHPIFITVGLSAAGILLFTAITPKDHGWHNIAFEAIRICFVSLEAWLRAPSKMNEDEGSRDPLMKLVDTLINNKRFWDSVRQTAHSPLDAQKILHLLGNGLPVLSGASQVLSMAYYQARIKFIPEARRVSEHATRALESGLSVTIRAFSVRRVAFTARFMSKIRRVSAGEEDQAAAGAVEMQGYGGGDAGQQEADEGV
ncbi:uncharacterized protein [Triticum aestivum]|uniref:uncharacterized protein n=1 Tax=Triticum aestivum TaxID=4565 RepID=UPI001D020F6E|nr:uncharacterized protein LOC123158443 [Triticum aestivum]